MDHTVDIFEVFKLKSVSKSALDGLEVCVSVCVCVCGKPLEVTSLFLVSARTVGGPSIDLRYAKGHREAGGHCWMRYICNGGPSGTCGCRSINFSGTSRAQDKVWMGWGWGWKR